MQKSSIKSIKSSSSSLKQGKNALSYLNKKHLNITLVIPTKATKVTISKTCKTLSQLSGSTHRTAEISEFSRSNSFLGRQVTGHSTPHSGSVLQSFCLTPSAFGREMHRFRQDRILNLWIIFLLRCKTLI